MQPIDLPSLLRAITWPVIVIVAFFVFRRPLSDLVGVLGRGVRKFSFAGVSLELAEVSQVRPHALDAEIRQLDAGPSPQSGSSGISDLINQLQYGGQRDYIVIDLGSQSSPRWLTSRLYLLTFLISLIHEPKCLVFVHTSCEISKRFLGIASPDAVRWALARTYPWLESSSSAAYAFVVAGLYCDPNAQVALNPAALQFDQQTGTLQNFQLVQCMQNFLGLIRLQLPTKATPPAPLITSVSPFGGPVGTSVTIRGANFGDASQPTKNVLFNGFPAEPSSWNDTEIVARVPPGATSGYITVIALGLTSNGVPFTVGPPDSADWLVLPSGALEHAKWLDESRLQRVIAGDLDASYVTLLPNKGITDLSNAILSQHGRFVAVVDPDKTFRYLVERSAVLEKLASEFSKQVSSNKS
ncbi:MAG TPA: IPT/TIG domain-containing protein [Candidatus Acidoferrum sp.]|nr:IPT/TIG domain-containing protein [Candidatus Acidoferrum sp.]